jgi:amidase
MKENITDALADDVLRGATAFQQLCWLAAGRIDSAALTASYRAAIDRDNPRLNAFLDLDAGMFAAAAASAARRREGRVIGRLDGLTVAVKDNIDVAGLPTRAGLPGRRGAVARDAAAVARLRAAGAVILGKTNLSEWANMRSTHSVSGWSGRGGQTRNPYARDRNTSGSSSGSGAAMAAGLATLAIGTETDGSIVSPSSICGIVGIKPTVGLVSRSGIIPIAHSQDTAGPMTRTVADAALLLAAIAGADPDDAATQAAPGQGVDYAAALRADGLRGKRLGVARNFFGGNPAVDAAIEAELAILRTQGATLVDVQVPNVDKYGDTELAVLLSEFRPDLEAWFAAYAPHAPVRTMADVIAFNDRHAARELRHFGQEHLIAAQARPGLEDRAYREALANNHRYSRAEGIDQVLREHRLDALVAPTGGTGWLTDYINGDHDGPGFSSPAAVAGYPHVTVPAGFVSGLPVGLSFVGGAWTEAALIAMAHAYEQASQRRRPPTFAASVNPKA